uniref:MULE transposase domain-containing protein n=1 Tax=Plectus sambesii TaxID=2011161 RepID=A0A914X2V8_9BILA
MAQQQMKLVPSSRKRKNGDVAFKGVLGNFIEEKRSADNITWVCKEKKKSQCNARLQTNMSMEVVNAAQNIHRNHVADCSKVKVMEAMAKLKQRVISTQESTSNIVNMTRHGTSVVSTVHLPLADLLRQKLCRQRVGELGEAMPADVQTMAIPHRFKFYQQKNFTTGHGIDKGELIIYTLPCLFALMPNRLTTTYYRRLLALRYSANLNPATCMTDFEEAAINAFREVWPDIQMSGCFFHLAQNQQKKLAQSTYRNKNLAIVVSEDLALYQQVKMICAMAFVPLADLDEVWDSLVKTMDHHLCPLFKYFNKYYIGKQLIGGGGGAMWLNFLVNYGICFNKRETACRAQTIRLKRFTSC